MNGNTAEKTRIERQREELEYAEWKHYRDDEEWDGLACDECGNPECTTCIEKGGKK